MILANIAADISFMSSLSKSQDVSKNSVHAFASMHSILRPLIPAFSDGAWESGRRQFGLQCEGAADRIHCGVFAFDAHVALELPSNATLFPLDDLHFLSDAKSLVFVGQTAYVTVRDDRIGSAFSDPFVQKWYNRSLQRYAFLDQLSDRLTFADKLTGAAKASSVALSILT
jgi:hypothetical protein